MTNDIDESEMFGMLELEHGGDDVPRFSAYVEDMPCDVWSRVFEGEKICVISNGSGDFIGVVDHPDPYFVQDGMIDECIDEQIEIFING